jgi:NAD(P)-dependent dehydrogenase (short-subunit alcohol dehydrogenase family)
MMGSAVKKPLVQSRTVLITGCSTGIGYGAAHYLRERGWTVYPTARKPDDLARLRDEGFPAVELDVADDASVGRAVETTLAATGGALGAVVNNAGFGQSGAIEDITRDILRRQFEVNVFGAHDLTQRLIPVFRRQGWGRVVNISSVFGRITMPMLGSYSASKFAMEALSNALRMEMRATGVGVSLIEPGPIASAFRDNATRQAQATLDVEGAAFRRHYRSKIDKRLAGKARPDPFTRGPEAVAVKIQHALESDRPRSRYCVTPPAYFGALLSRFAPDWLIDAALASKVPTPDSGNPADRDRQAEAAGETAG